LLSDAPSPAIFPERIGIIGSTQGVNASSARRPGIREHERVLFWKSCATSRSLEKWNGRETVPRREAEFAFDSIAHSTRRRRRSLAR